MEPQTKLQASVFSREERVRLSFLLRDLLPPPQLTWSGGEERGEEMWALYELLQRALGRMQIGSGDGIAAILSDFIMKANEDELFTMIELLPAARAAGIKKRQSPFEQFTRSEHESILRSVNQFLSRIGSLARFDAQGRFNRDGFVDQTPAGLKKLPGKEALQSDLNRLQDDVLAIIYFDLDHFKQVNDTSGHSAGDKCLERVAEIVGLIVAHKGRLYRYGGDEFVILLRNFSVEEAAATAERIRASIQKASVGGSIPVTTSMGVVATNIEQIDRNEMIRAADTAMYESKRAGRNLVTVWTPGTGYTPPKTDTPVGR